MSINTDYDGFLLAWVTHAGPQLNDTSVAYVSKADIISAGGPEKVCKQCVKEEETLNNE